MRLSSRARSSFLLLFLPPWVMSPVCLLQEMQLLSVGGWACGLGCLIHGAEVYLFSASPALALSVRGVEGSWGIFLWPTFFREGLLGLFWRWFKASYIISAVPCSKVVKKKQLKVLKYKAYFLSSSFSLDVLWCFKFRQLNIITI